MIAEHIPFDVEMPAATTLRAGSLQCLYENHNLRYIKYGDTELVRMIYPAVRDADWSTVPFTVSNENIRRQKDSFIITYTALFKQDEIFFTFDICIKGKADNTICFSMNGTASGSFETNRTGLCVHLPIKECKVRPVKITTSEGVETPRSFPENICPQELFSGFNKIEFETTKGLKVELNFEGDVFECEDQRNWMDHSFKIYSRPLSLPFPYYIKKGENTQQAITLKLNISNTFHDSLRSEKDDADKYFPIPSFGFDGTNNEALGEKEISIFNKIYLSHYRAEIDFDKDWKKALIISIDNARQLNASLELVLFFTDNYEKEVGDFIAALKAPKQIVKSILLLHKEHKVTPAFLQTYCYPLFKRSYKEIKIGYGTDVYFAELNRQRPLSGLYDFVSFSINPQVHAFDTRSLLENINTIDDIILTIKSFTNKPIYISPVTFRKRKNHDGTGDDPRQPVNNFDERQYAWFGAGWFLLCLFALRKTALITFFHTNNFSGDVIKVVPLYQVLKQLAAFKPAEVKKKEENNSIQISFRNKKQQELTFIMDDFKNIL